MTKISNYASMSLLVACFFCSCFPAAANDALQPAQKQKIRVGFYKQDGYHEQDANGIKRGYGYDMLQYLLPYADWEYEYVGYTLGWSEIIQALDDGKIDMVTFADKTPERLKKYVFSNLPFGHIDGGLFIRADEKRFTLSNIKKWPEISVGILRNSSKNALLPEYAAKMGFRCRTVEFKYDRDLQRALYSGEIDAVWGTNVRRMERSEILLPIDPKPYYVMMKKGNPALKSEVDRAMRQLFTDEPTLREILQARHYGANFHTDGAVSFSASEKKYIQRRNAKGEKVRVLVKINRKPLAYMENGKLKGMMKDYIDLLSKRTNLQFDMIPYTNAAPSDDYEIDSFVWADFNHAEDLNVILTKAYLNSPISQLRLKSARKAVRKVGYVQGCNAAKSVMRRNVPNTEFIAYDSMGKTLNALKDGEVDAVYNSAHVIEQAIHDDSAGLFQSHIMPGYSISYAMGISRNAPRELYSIINKGVNGIPPSFAAELLAQNAMSATHRITIEDWIHLNPLKSILLCAIPLFLVIGIMLIVIIVRRNAYKLGVLVEKMPVRYFVIDLNGKILNYYLGDDPTEYKKKLTSIEDFPPDAAAVLKEYIPKVISTKVNHTFEYDIHGTRHSVRLSALPDQRYGKKTVVAISQDTTELQNARNQAMQALDLFNLVIETAPAMIFVKDVNNDFRYMIANKVFCDFVGKKPHEVIGFNDAEIFSHAKDADWFRECDQKVIDAGVRQDFDEFIQDAAGSMRTLKVNKLPVHGANDTTLLLGFTVDLTELTKKEIERQKTLAMWNLVLDTLPVLIYANNPADDYRYVICNKATANFHGKTEEEFIGHTALEIFGASQSFTGQDKQVIEENKVLECVDMLPDINGKIHYFSTTKIPFSSPDGTKLMLGMSIDETAVHVALEQEKLLSFCMEIMLQNMNMSEALGKTLEKIREYFDGGRCYMVRCNHENRTINHFIECVAHGRHPAFVHVADYPYTQWTERFMTHPNFELNDVQNNYIDAGLAAWRDFFESNDIRSFYVQRIMLNNQLWGYWVITFEGRDYKVKENEKNICGAISHCIEQMLYRRQYEEELIAAKDKAQAADKAKSFFIASVSHELRTPLNAVIGFSELLQKGDVTPEEQRDYLTSISDGGNALLQLINDILDLSKLEADQMEVIRTPCNFKDLAEETLAIFRYQAIQKGISLRFNPQNDIPTLLLDNLRLRQIFFNLIGNAVKFTEAGSVTLDASFVADHADSGTLTFKVRDTGVGVPREDIERMMSPFVQLGRMRGTNSANKGTGLGLSICKRMIKRKGGELKVESELGKGSIFTVTLPNVQICTSPVKGPAKELPPATIFDRDKLKVLVVDDVALNLKVLQSMCKKAGLTQVQTAYSGAEALALLKVEHYDLILTDMWMPEMDGVGLAAKIKAIDSYKDVPVIAVTADAESQKNFDLDNFAGILLKPVTMEKIEKAIQLTINRMFDS